MSNILKYQNILPTITTAVSAIATYFALRAINPLQAPELATLAVSLLVWAVGNLLIIRAQLLANLNVARIAANAIDQMIWIERYPSGETAFATSAYEQVWGSDSLTLFQAAESRLEMVHPDDRQRVRREVRVGQAGREPFHTEFRMQTAAGAERVMLVKLFPYGLKDGPSGYWIGFATDVTEDRRKQLNDARSRLALRALALVNAAISRAQSRSELHNLVCECLVESGGYAAAWIGLREFSPTDKIRVTAHAATHLDYITALDIRPDDPVLGQGPTAKAVREGRVCVSHSVSDDPHLAPWREAALDQGFKSIAAFPLLRDGRAFGSLTLYSTQLGAFTADEMRILEELSVSFAQGLIAIEATAELLNSHKMRLIGQIAGELSHDFNNILGIISTHAEIGGREVVGEPGRNRFAVIAQAALRGIEITNSILGIARHPRGIPEVANVNTLTSRLITLIRAAVGPGIDVQVQLADRDLLAEIDPAGFNNALVNLAINARDAMAETGILTLRTRLCDQHDEAPLRAELPAQLQSRPLVVVEVADTGSGMAEDVRERAFEPFFSTKGPGKGTGLGLAAVNGFAVHHGGTARILSSSPSGTTLQILLPAIVTHTHATGHHDRALPEPIPGKLKVLIVDNEQPLLAGMVETLNFAGHAATACTSSRDALDALAAQQFDVLICDLLLDNGEDGSALARQAVLHDPALRVILMSGNAARGNETEPEWPLLEKPFSVDRLVEQLSKTVPGAPAT